MSSRIRGTICSFPLAGVLLLTSPAGLIHAGLPARRVAVAWNDSATNEGKVQAMEIDPPWQFTTTPLTVGLDAVLRYAFGRLYAVSPTNDTINVIDATTWSIVAEHTFAAGSLPQDIAVVTPRRAFVTRASATGLLRIDPVSGVTQEAADLAPFADPDGNPDMGMLSVHAGRVFIQVRRYDNAAFQFVPPAYLAVVDAATGELIDVDPSEPGVQAITLAGTAPKAKMHVVAQTRRLFVGATGNWWDGGGIEMINLDALGAIGLVVSEADDQTGADLGAFAMTGADRGALVFTTDFALSTHLALFTIPGGVNPNTPQYADLDYFAPVVLHERSGDRLFLPRGGSNDNGVNVFEAATGVQLTTSPIATGGPPTDLALITAGCDAAGDLNGDGATDGRDVRPLVECLLNGPLICLCADLNGDGRADGADTSMFVELVLQN